ncbi:MAG: hypothetical protein ISQ13_00240 [Candidatus Margulisbacteria bacterium]|nr:hypothetical protein [Candidatus Margulisiibacteriota bacterium]
MKLIVVWLVLIQGIFFSIETGVLNVFTDLPKAVIKVDGLAVAQEAVVKLPLEVGEHYVQVELNNDLVYAEKVTIESNRSSTVISDHFVDIITKTPSRGAINREAERLRESRGSFGLGFGSSSVLHGVYLSTKWWATKHFGGQLLLGGKYGESDDRGLVGGRVFFSPADKIYADQVLSGLVFIGGGQKTSAMPAFSHSATTLSRSYTEVGITVEAFIGQLVKELTMAVANTNSPLEKRGTMPTYRSEKKDENDDDSSSDEPSVVEYARAIGLVIVILTQIGHTSAELSLVQFENQIPETNLAFGVHFYF